MNSARIALLLLAAPATALAQVSYSSARIVPDASWNADEVSCVERHNVLADRRMGYDEAKREVDREGESIARASDRLAEDLRHLNANDGAAVAAYNERSADHNRRVADHNRRVADLTARASSLNRDSVDAASYCNGRMRNPDLIVWERIRIR